MTLLSTQTNIYSDLGVLKTLTADTYFPAVTNISSRHLEKITVVAFPTLRPAAGLPQMASLLAMLHTTTLPKQRGTEKVRGRQALKRRSTFFSGSRKKERKKKGMKELHWSPDVSCITLDVRRRAGDISKVLKENDNEARNKWPHQWSLMLKQRHFQVSKA